MFPHIDIFLSPIAFDLLDLYRIFELAPTRLHIPVFTGMDFAGCSPEALLGEHPRREKPPSPADMEPAWLKGTGLEMGAV
jgi:hypothetical protein